MNNIPTSGKDRPGGRRYYERRLPHWQPDGAALFITWRLHGSVPKTCELSSNPDSPKWLEDPRVAQCVVDALGYGDTVLRIYDLRAWVLMLNHVHILIYPNADLSRITKAIKNYSARQANLILGRTGQPFWQHESYDHWVRDQPERERIRNYIENNPVKAGLVERPEDYRWSSARIWQRCPLENEPLRVDVARIDWRRRA